MTDKKAFLKFDLDPLDKAKFIRAAKARDQKLIEWVMDALLDEYARMLVTGEVKTNISQR